MIFQFNSLTASRQRRFNFPFTNDSVSLNHFQTDLLQRASGSIPPSPQGA